MSDKVYLTTSGRLISPVAELCAVYAQLFQRDDFTDSDVEALRERFVDCHDALSKVLDEVNGEISTLEYRQSMSDADRRVLLDSHQPGYR